MTMPDPIKPTAADREAAASAYYAWIGSNPVIPRKMTAGEADGHSMVQAFALHAQQAREQALEEAAKVEGQLSRATYALMEFDIHRYLIANVRHDGAEKAQRHRELTEVFLRVYAPNWKKRDRETYTRIHAATQELTNNLDKIGLGSDCHYDDAVPKAFHDQFVSLAIRALKEQRPC